MDNLIGYPLRDALRIIEETKKTREDKNNIVKIKKIMGTNSKFNDLKSPYVIRYLKQDNYITLCVSYY
nr:hypothetical protein [Sedimentibacter sp.]